MNIAYAVTPEQPVPPPKYGGNEKQADIIARRLVALGHNLTLFCGPGSSCPVPKRVTKYNSTKCEPDIVKDIYKHREEFDVIIDMTANHLIGQQIQDDCGIVSIMTGDPHKKYAHDNVRNRVYVSREFAAFNGCPDHPVLHNIIHDNPSSVRYDWEKKNYALYVGVIRAEKGIELAVDTCDALNIPFKIGGPVMARDRVFWNRLKHRKCVDYLGIVDNNSEEKWKLFGEAKVFLYPISWCDAGPLAPMEAMLAGTPVVSFPKGGICSDIDDLITGCLVRGGDENFQKNVAFTHALNWPAKPIHDWILDKVDPDKYVADLLALCERSINGEEW